MTVQLTGRFDPRQALTGTFDPVVRLTGRIGLFVPPPGPIWTNLTAWWSLDEAEGVRADSHGGHSMSVVGTDPARVDGLVAGAAQNDKNGFLHNSDALWASWGDFSAAIWFYPTKSFDYTNLMACLLNPIGGLRSWLIDILMGELKFSIARSSDGFFETVKVPGVLPLNQWHLAAVRWQASTQTAGVSLDGGAFIEAVLPASMRQGAYPIVLGTPSNGFSTYNFDDPLDEAAIWRDYLLTDEDVTWLYNAGAGRSYADFAEEFGP